MIRIDVIMKKGLRACRSFYANLFLDNQKMKQRPSLDNLIWKHLLVYTDQLCRQIFDQELLNLLNTDAQAISNHFIALILSRNQFKDFLGCQVQQMVERVNIIKRNAANTKQLFDSFNESKMDQFLLAKENLILMEYFLQNQKQHFMGLEKLKKLDKEFTKKRNSKKNNDNNFLRFD